MERLARVDYWGAVDDVVERNSWGYRVDRRFLNRSLTAAAAFGVPLALNDGYLLHYEAGQRALRDRTYSPLIDLIATGYVVVLSRNGGAIYDVPVVGAEQGIESYRRLVQSSEWNDLRRSLLSFAPSMKWTDWPKRDIGYGFTKLVLGLRDRDVSELALHSSVTQSHLNRTLDEFYERMQEDPGQPPRTRWERLCLDETLGDLPPDGRSSMIWLANEAYHFNFAACMAEDERFDHVGVNTRFSSAYPQMRQIDDGAMVEFESMRIHAPKIPFDRLSESPRTIRELVEYGSRLNRCKNDYLAALDSAIATGDAKITKDAALRYARKLGESMGDEKGDGKAVIVVTGAVTAVIGGIGGGVGILLDSALTGGILGASTGALGYVIGKTMPHVQKFFRCRSVEVGKFRGSAAAIRTAIRRSRATASTLIDPVIAKEHASHIPKFSA